MVPDDSDKELGARLDSALRSQLGSQQVDVPALLIGSHYQASRRRTRRVGVAAVVTMLVLGLPAAFEVLRSAPQAQDPSAVLLPGSRPRAGLAGSSRAAAVPSVPIPSAAGPSETAPSVPAGLALTPQELPPGMVQHAVSPITSLPLVDGQACTPQAVIANRPLTGRRWLWLAASTAVAGTAGPASGSTAAPVGGSATAISGADAGRITVQLTVTNWAQGQAMVRFNDLVTGAGGCHWLQPQQVVPDFAPQLSDQSWSGGSAPGPNQDLTDDGRAVVRVGDWIAGVQVQWPGGGPSSIRLAQQLAADEAGHLSHGAPRS